MNKKYEVKITKVETIAQKTKAFTLQKPQDYHYKAGQFFEVILNKASVLSGEEASHIFSIASAPHESELLFATRMRSSEYKKALDKVAPGDSLEISEAEGDFILHDDENIPAVLLTGGIGITTGISILKDACFHDRGNTITVIDSNSHPDDAPFFNELVELNKKMNNLTFVETITKIDQLDTKWAGEKGKINLSMIKEYVKDPTESQYYLVGPPGLVEYLEDVLKEAEVKKSMITEESYSGY